MVCARASKPLTSPRDRLCVPALGPIALLIPVISKQHEMPSRSDAALTSLPLGRSGARSKSLEGPCGFKRVIRFHCIVLMHIVVLKNVPTPALSRQTLNVFTPTLSSNPPCSRNNLHMSEMIIRNRQIFCRALLSEHGCAHTLLDACTTDGDGRKYSSA